MFGVCFGLVPFSQCLSYWIYSGKQILVRKYLNKSTYASDENIKYSGFGEKIPNYEEQGMKSPQEWIYTYPHFFYPQCQFQVHLVLPSVSPSLPTLTHFYPQYSFLLILPQVSILIFIGFHPNLTLSSYPNEIYPQFL